MNLPLNIDLQQIFLHMLNFVILAGGLYFILYSPVKKFMDQREAHYAEMDQAAADKLAEVEEQIRSGALQVFDPSTFTVEGAELTTCMALDTDGWVT